MDISNTRIRRRRGNGGPVELSRYEQRAIFVPVGGEYGTEVEWRYSYQVIPRGGAATDTAG